MYFVAALILQGPDEAWPVHLQLATGLKLGHFVEVATAVFSQCFHNTTIDSRYFKRTGERLVETRFKAASGRTVDSIPTMQQFNQAVANCLASTRSTCSPALRRTRFLKTPPFPTHSSTRPRQTTRRWTS